MTPSMRSSGSAHLPRSCRSGRGSWSGQPQGSRPIHEYIATAHEDQKFGFSIAGGTALSALLSCHQHSWLELIGIHSHIGSQIFDAEGFEVAARRTLRLHADFAAQTGVQLGELDLGGGFGIAYTSADTPATPAVLAQALREIIANECSALDISVPHVSIEPGRAISGPSIFALYRVGTVKLVALDGGAAASTSPSTGE